MNVRNCAYLGIWKVIMTYFKTVSWYLSQETEENHENPQVRIDYPWITTAKVSPLHQPRPHQKRPFLPDTVYNQAVGFNYRKWRTDINSDNRKRINKTGACTTSTKHS